MYSSSFQLLLSLLPLAFAAPNSRSTKAHHLYLSGDSTMVATGDNDGTVGWGALLPKYLNISQTNTAVAGRSARSFTREGRFGAIANNVTAGDYVVMEFGLNDETVLFPVDNSTGKADCDPVEPTGYDTTCTTFYNGTELVLTYTRYLTNAAMLFRARGANVIISTSSTRDVWQTGTFRYTPPVFTQYGRDVASASGAVFVDHGEAMAEAYKRLGADVVNSYYPNDHTHTSEAGADVGAATFITALLETNSTLARYVNTQSYTGPVGQ